MIDRPEDGDETTIDRSEDRDATTLARFAQWLRDARAEADADADDLVADLPTVGLERLVEEFTALRHEVKLQTKSARGLQDQAEALLPAMKQAIDQFRAVAPKEEQAAQAAGRPLAEALADLDEALDRGYVEIERARRRIAEDADATEATLRALHAGQRWLRRALTRPYHERVVAAVRDQALVPRRAIFEALLEGYGLIQARLRRAMKAERIARIACEGQPVDPERMTVVEVVDDPTTPPGVVVDEVRRGYTWQGRVLRFAEVRAARTPAEDETPDGSDGSADPLDLEV